MSKWYADNQQSIEYDRRVSKLKKRAFTLLQKHPEGLTMRAVERALHRARYSRRVWEKAFADLLTSRWVVKTVKPAGPKQHFGLTTLENAKALRIVPGIDPLTEAKIMGDDVLLKLSRTGNSGTESVASFSAN